MATTIPYKFTPRFYQIPFLGAVAQGIKRAIKVWPRRHGKDKTDFNALIIEALKRTGNYFYVFPTYSQGKKALWLNIDKDGFRTLDHCPPEIRKSLNHSEMRIELINGSTIQIVGAQNVDSIVGSNPAGIVFSEYSLIDPNVLGYLLPIVEENGGFIWFNFTPRGENHAKELYNQYLQDPDWYVSKLTAKDCGVFSQKQLDKIRKDYYKLYGSYELFDQEFNTSFAAPIQGAYYSVQISLADKEGRIASVPYDGRVAVNTAWDLGVNDTTAIWFWQTVGKEVHIIDHYESSGQELGHYVNILNSKPYTYQKHFLPHDANARELQSGISRRKALEDLGLNVEVLPSTEVMAGIDKVRGLLPRCWFDAEKCERGLSCLRQYHKSFDERNKIYRDRPEHDWSSNSADAFRYLAVAYKDNYLRQTQSSSYGGANARRLW